MVDRMGIVSEAKEKIFALIFDSTIKTRRLLYRHVVKAEPGSSFVPPQRAQMFGAFTDEPDW
jgi:hypothetical protein